MKIISFPNNRFNIEFALWFVIGITCTIIFYKPFQQPIFFDRAYLLYMSQVVYRGDALYQSTTFGYTPFSTIMVGLFMKLGALFSINTIISARIIGLLLYGIMCGAFFIMSQSLFKSKWAASISVLSFCGLGYIQILSGVNAEPKLWVLMFSILGIYFFSKEKWLYVGLSFSLAAMSWHVAVISLFACFVMLPWKTKAILPSFLKLSTGVILGVLPAFIYLLLTNGWIDFWNQAILRKIMIDGETLGENPLLWLKFGVYPYFLTEPLHFIFSAIGVLSGIYILLRKSYLNIIDKKNLIFLLVYCFFWSVFNTVEFSMPVDLFPLIPIVIIFSTYLLFVIRKKIKSSLAINGCIVLLFIYNFYDAITYEIPYNFSDQVKKIKGISKKYSKVFVIGFEEYYVINEEALPTKFIKYIPYEDNLIEYKENGCIGIQELIIEKQFDAIIVIDLNKNIKSEKAQYLVDLFKKKTETHYELGKCANSIIMNLCNPNKKEIFNMSLQTLPFKDIFYSKQHYVIYKITND